jgi:hypothetical protein
MPGLGLFMASRPGRVFGQSDSGRQVPRWEIPLLDGQSAQILARVDRIPAGITFSVDAPADKLEEIRTGVADGSIDHLLLLDSDKHVPVRLFDTGIVPSTSKPTQPTAH